MRRWQWNSNGQERVGGEAGSSLNGNVLAITLDRSYELWRCGCQHDRALLAGKGRLVAEVLHLKGILDLVRKRATV